MKYYKTNTRQLLTITNELLYDYIKKQQYIYSVLLPSFDHVV